MRPEFLARLKCPKSGQELHWTEQVRHEEEFSDAWLTNEDGGIRYPIIRGIPRFVQETNYADNFGMQWNYFRKTQLDSFSHQPVSATRFWNSTGWRPRDLEGKWVLDAGCGAGRFAEIALEAGANVVALDYSNAVDACRLNLGKFERLHVVQGDILALPFADASFDFVYSLGVLQHTPDVERSFSSLVKVLSPGGHICVDYYERTYKSFFHPKYYLRPLTKRIPRESLFKALQWLTPRLLKLSEKLNRVPRFGRVLSRLVPVANYTGVYRLNEEQLREWALLDTFDWLSPMYDKPQTAATAERWALQGGLVNVSVKKNGHLVACGQKAN